MNLYEAMHLMPQAAQAAKHTYPIDYVWEYFSSPTSRIQGCFRSSDANPTLGYNRDTHSGPPRTSPHRSVGSLPLKAEQLEHALNSNFAVRPADLSIPYRVAGGSMMTPTWASRGLRKRTRRLSKLRCGGLHAIMRMISHHDQGSHQLILVRSCVGYRTTGSTTST